MRVSSGIGGADGSVPVLDVPLVGSASPDWTQRWCVFWQRDGRTDRVWQVDLAHGRAHGRAHDREVDPDPPVLVCQTMPDPPTEDVTDTDGPRAYAALCATSLLLAATGTATGTATEPGLAQIIAATADLDGPAWSDSELTLDGTTVASRRSTLSGIDAHLLRLDRRTGHDPGWVGVYGNGLDPTTIALVSGVDQADYPFRRVPEPS